MNHVRLFRTIPTGPPYVAIREEIDQDPYIEENLRWLIEGDE